MSCALSFDCPLAHEVIALQRRRSTGRCQCSLQLARIHQGELRPRGASFSLLCAILTERVDSIQGERNYIMQVVCEATQSPSSAVQVAAFECLVRIMHLYYDQMKFYMERALFGVSPSGSVATIPADAPSRCSSPCSG